MTDISIYRGLLWNSAQHFHLSQLSRTPRSAGTVAGEGATESFSASTTPQQRTQQRASHILKWKGRHAFIVISCTVNYIFDNFLFRQVCVNVTATTPKWKYRHTDRFFVSGYTKGYRFDNFRSSQWRNIHQCGHLPFSVWFPGHHKPI